MGRSAACCEKLGLKRGAWTTEEDQKLRAYIDQHGHGSWRSLPPKAGLQRCGKSCRLRWINYLRPDIKRGQFNLQEGQTIIQLHALLGNRWSAIAAHLPKRTDNEIKNYWNTHLKKRLTKMGIDPVTHKPKSDALGSGQSDKDAAHISHMAQWETARLEAESRLVRESKLLLYSNRFQSSQLGSLTTHSNHDQVFNNKACPQKMPLSLDGLKPWQGAWTATTKSIPENNATLLRYLINSNNGTQESPTSTLNFSENIMFNIPSTLEFPKDARNNWNQKIEVQEMVNYYCPAMDHGIYNSDMLMRLPSNMECFDDAPLLGNEDNNANNLISTSIEQHGDDLGGEKDNNYWDNMLNLVKLQPGSHVF